MSTTPVPLSMLVEDFTIYPRHAVDDQNVASLVSAYKTGSPLPPIVAEGGSYRIVDGFHRSRMYRRVLGPEAVVDVELVAYDSEDALLLDAIARNSGHGRKLDVMDQTRAIEMCRARGIELQAVAHVLHLPMEKARKLSVRIATAPSEGSGTVPRTLSVALKRPVMHLAGTDLTAEQVAAHERAPGSSYLLIAQQLTDALAVGFIPASDPRLLLTLRQLSEQLQQFLGMAA